VPVCFADHRADTSTTMDIKSGYPFWAIKNGLMHAFPKLERDLHCEVAVLGGGISGALIADELASHGHDVALIDQRDIAWGSTSASTALLQYEIDTPLVELAKRYGETDAVRAYRACADAIGLLADKAAEVRDVGFARTQSLYYASKPGHVTQLRREFELRARHRFDVRWMEAPAIRAVYGFAAPAAILSGLSARVDPYRMTYRLLMRLQRRGVAVFDRTRIDHIQATTRGVTLRTSDDQAVKARHVVIAAGYEGQRWLHEAVASNHSTYAFVTDPIDRATLGPLGHTLLWETARPYLYLRATADGRLMVGGADDRIDAPRRRDARLPRKTRGLLERLHSLFPQLPLTMDFAWAGTFAETRDGLPFFGAHRQHGPRVLFAMAYGGNGTTYSMIGAGLVRALLERRSHPLASLFSFNRLAR
jgi:glycine/D-amino acid oxidase-like deaminating enzyme